MRGIRIAIAVAMLVVGVAGCSLGNVGAGASSTARSGAQVAAPANPTGTVSYEPPRYPDPPAPKKTYLTLAQAQAKVAFRIREIKDPSGPALRDFVLDQGWTGSPAVKMRDTDFIEAQFHEESTETAAKCVQEYPPMPFDSRYMERVDIGGAQGIGWNAIDTRRGYNDGLVVPFSCVVFQIGPDWFTAHSLNGKIDRHQLVRMARDMASR